MKIGIAGVGGIGSNVAMHLVRIGFSNIVLVDFDRVEPSNLNRQFYFLDQIGDLKVEALAVNLMRINPRVRLTCLPFRLDERNIADIFSQCTLVVEGLDRPDDKKMLLEQLGQTKMIVSASGIAGSSLSNIICKRFGQSIIVGDHVSDCASSHLFSHKVSAVACHMTECILNMQKGVL